MHASHHLALAFSLLLGTGALAASGVARSATLAVPASHPRLWYDAQPGSPGFARLQRARAFAVQNPVPIPGWSPSDRARQLALRSLIRGQADPATDNGCQQAVQWLHDFTMNVGGVSSDQARWDGENAILVYDWGHYAIGQSDRTMLLARWNGYIATLNAKPWGGLAMPANNYFGGYLRNGLLWGIASYHDSGATQRATAQGFIDHALNTRYSTWPRTDTDDRRLAAVPEERGRFGIWHQAFGGGLATCGLQPALRRHAGRDPRARRRRTALRDVPVQRRRILRRRR